MDMTVGAAPGKWPNEVGGKNPKCYHCFQLSVAISVKIAFLVRLSSLKYLILRPLSIDQIHSLSREQLIAILVA